MSKERLVWAFDCDDVIVDTTSALITAYNDRYNADITTHRFYDREDTWGAASVDEAIYRVDVLLREGITTDLAPSQETIESLQYLASVDELHMVTGRQTYLEEATHRMLERYLPGVFTTVEHTNYYLVQGSELKTRTKGEVCAQIGADILVDDHVDHGLSVLENGLKEVIVWGNYPWNQKKTLAQGMVRCATWNEVFRERERILASR